MKKRITLYGPLTGKLSLFLLTAFIFIPIGLLFFSWILPVDEAWIIWSQFKWEILGNTFLLIFFVGLGCLILGVSLAWFTSACEYPGRGFFEWSLLLPFSIPTYVLGFVFIGWWDMGGDVHLFFQSTFKTEISWISWAREKPGLIIVMSLAFYPYVYFLSRQAFLSLGSQPLHVSESLGRTKLQSVIKVLIPISLPWIMGGLLMALMETLADFGTVSLFNVETFTTAIYKSWDTYFSKVTAYKLACFLVIIAMGFLVLERKYRNKRQFFAMGKLKASQRIQLSKGKGLAVTVFCSLVLLGAFVIPFIQLIYWFVRSLDLINWAKYPVMLFNSITLAVLGVIFILLLAIWLSYGQRIYSKSSFVIKFSQIATMGYALPGTVLAVAIFQCIAKADDLLGYFNSPFFLQDTLLILLISYSVRFLSVGYFPVSSGLLRISPKMDFQAKSAGLKSTAVIQKIHGVLLRPALLIGAALVMVDILKEMPITLMMRPFGWETLAVDIYGLTAEGEYERAAFPALILIIIGIFPVYFLTRTSKAKYES